MMKTSRSSLRRLGRCGLSASLHLERTCLALCQDSRYRVARNVVATSRAPRSLWCEPRTKALPDALRDHAIDKIDDNERAGSEATALEVTAGSVSSSARETTLAPSMSDTRGSSSGFSERSRDLYGHVSSSPTLGVLALLQEYGIGTDEHQSEQATSNARRRSREEALGTLGGVGSTGDVPLSSCHAKISKRPSTKSTEFVKRQRIVPVKVVGMRCELPIKALRASWFRWPEGVKHLTFWPIFNQSIRGVTLPKSLESLSFGYHFNRSLTNGQIEWPEGLKCLKLGTKWNQPLHDARETWPLSLESLTFGADFDQKLSGIGVSLPWGLRELSLGYAFNQPLAGVEWPPGLEKLTLSESFNQPLEEMSWPVALRELRFGGKFNQALAHADFPISLEMLEFGHAFRHYLQAPNEGHTFLPQRLKNLVLGTQSYQSLGRTTLPAGLREFFCSGMCRFSSGMQWPSGLVSITGAHFFCGETVRLPSQLESLVTCNDFRQPLNNFVFPSTLRRLTLGNSFNHSLDAVELPDGLEELWLGDTFNHDIRGLRLPRGLKHLHFSFGSKFDQEVTSIEWPAGLEELHFGSHFNRPLEGSALPPRLKKLHLGFCFAYSLQAVPLPQTLQSLRLPACYPLSHLQGLDWPRNMRTLAVGGMELTSRQEMISVAVGHTFRGF